MLNATVKSSAFIALTWPRITEVFEHEQASYFFKHGLLLLYYTKIEEKETYFTQIANKCAYDNLYHNNVTCICINPHIHNIFNQYIYPIYLTDTIF